MNINKYLIAGIYTLAQCSFSNNKIHTLERIAFNSIFNISKWDEIKDKVNQDLKDGKYNKDLFKNKIFENLDLSGMYFRGFDFTGSTFKNVILKDADFTDACFDEVKFIKSNVEGIILYVPLDNKNEPVKSQEFRLKSTIDHNDLFEIYSELRNQIDQPQFSLDEKFLSKKHLESLNNIFPTLDLCIINENLIGKNLKNINLSNTMLYNCSIKDTNLQNANLKNIDINCSSFKNTNLQDTNFENAKMKEANFENCNLKNINLENTIIETNFLYSFFKESNMQGSNLVFTKSNMQGAKISGAKVSGDSENDFCFFPKNCTDDDILEAYNSLSINSICKSTVKEILIARQILTEKN